MHVLRIAIHLLIPEGYCSRSRQSKPSLPVCQIKRHLRFIAYIVHFLRICVVQKFFQPSFAGGGARPPIHSYAYAYTYTIPNLSALRSAARGDLVVPRTRLQLVNGILCGWFGRLEQSSTLAYPEDG